MLPKLYKACLAARLTQKGPRWGNLVMAASKMHCQASDVHEPVRAKWARVAPRGLVGRIPPDARLTVPKLFGLFENRQGLLQ